MATNAARTNRSGLRLLERSGEATKCQQEMCEGKIPFFYPSIDNGLAQVGVFESAWVAPSEAEL